MTQEALDRLPNDALCRKQHAPAFANDDPLFGMWRDREDMADVSAFTPAVSQRAAGPIDALALLHSMRFADALIGATALEHGFTPLTANTHHFAAVEGLQMETFVP